MNSTEIAERLEKLVKLALERVPNGPLDEATEGALEAMDKLDQWGFSYPAAALAAAGALRALDELEDGCLLPTQQRMVSSVIAALCALEPGGSEE